MDPAPDHNRVFADKYEVLGVLGEGGTGIVYDAVTPDGRAIALKVMHEELAGDKQIRGRFQREAAILRRLEGKHVCPILDFGEVPSETSGTTLLYIALPKIDGESLEDLLAKGLVDVGRALDIMLEVLEALRSAHAQGVIHRDLKPANVLLASPAVEARSSNLTDASAASDAASPSETIDARSRVLVVDFGMSKIVTGTGIGTTNLTTHNMVFGTPEYMSPEQARGDELDERCDVYAAGVILYEILTGTPPFTGDTPLTVLTAHLTSDLEPPSTRPKATGRVTPALEAVVLHALARERDERYPSAVALASAIRHARVTPDDVQSLRPEAFSDAPPGAEAFALTVPAVLPIDHAIATAATVMDRGPFASAPPPSLGPGPPPRVLHSEPPPTTRPPRILPPLSSPEPAITTRTWILVWIVVGLVSIAFGVWTALRQP